MADNINLATVWEWDLITGDPIVPPDDFPNRRYCPSIEEMGLLLDGRQGTDDYLQRRILTFMTSNETRLIITIDTSKNADNVKSFLTFVRGLNLKKIHLNYRGSGYVEIIKLPRGTNFNGEPDGVVNLIRNGKNLSVYRLAEDVTNNALLGWEGPGTFPCAKRGCALCQHVGRVPVVSLGPRGLIHLTKRASCVTHNAVYLCVCLQCGDEDSFSCYFGESSQELRRRCQLHEFCPCNTKSILRDKTRFRGIQAQRAEIKRVIDAGFDPDDVLRDWFAHVTTGGIHEGRHAVSVVDIINHPFLRKTRERELVRNHMFWNGDFHYLGLGRGCLNTYHNN